VKISELKSVMAYITETARARKLEGCSRLYLDFQMAEADTVRDDSYFDTRFGKRGK